MAPIFLIKNRQEGRIVDRPNFHYAEQCTIPHWWDSYLAF